MGKKKPIDITGIPEFDLVNPIKMPGEVSQPHTRSTPADFEDKAVQKRAEDKYKKDNPLDPLALPPLAIKGSWIESGLYRASERNAESRDFRPATPDFKVDDDYLDLLPTTYSLENRAYLKESKSQDEYAARQRWVDEDIKRGQSIAAYGGSGVVASVLASLFDPAMLPLLVATGGESFLASTARIGKMSRTAASFGVQGAVMEGTLAAGDTQKSATDVLHGFVGGAVLGGAFGAVTKLSSKAAMSAHIADGLDAAMSKDALAILETPTFQREFKATQNHWSNTEPHVPVGLPEPRVAPVLDALSTGEKGLEVPAFIRQGKPHPLEPKPVEPAVPEAPKVYDEHVTLDNKHIDESIAAHRRGLEALGKKDMGGRAGAALKKKLREGAEALRADIAEIAETLNNHRATVASSMGAARNADHATTIAYRMQGIGDIYTPALERAQSRLAAIEERLTLAKEASGSRKALDTFNSKPRIEQIHELYPEGAPKSRELIERHSAALEAVSVPAEVSDAARAKSLLDKLDPEPDLGIDLATGESLTREVTPERAAKIDALLDRTTSGQTTKEFLKSLVDKAVTKGKVAKQYLPTQALRDRFQGAFTTLDASVNQAFRGMNFMLHDAPQGGFVPERTAAQFQDIYLKQIRTQEMHGWSEGFASWSADQGRGPVAAIMNFGGHKREFDQAVFLKVFNPSRESHAGVTQAADAHRRGLARALQIRKEAGEAGFADIVGDPNYMTIIFDSNSIVHASAGVGNTERVKALVSKSYQQGKFKLSQNSADRMAEMQIRRSQSHQLTGNQVFKNVVSKSEEAAFIKDLQTHGVPDEFIANLLAEREATDIMNNVSNRAKFSLGLNPETEHDGLRMVDLLNSDTTVLTQNYYRESAGGAALAKTGFKSFDHANRVINQAEQTGLELGANAARNGQEAEMLRDSVKMLYGKPLVENADDLLHVSLRRGMSWVALRSLGMLGFAQMPETARAMAMFGTHEVLSNIPAVSFFRRKSARTGGVYSGELLDPLNRDIEFALGYQGEDKLLAPMHIREESFSGISDPSGRIGKILDNGLALGANINNVASGFQATQGGIEKVVARSIYQKLIKMAEGEVPFGASSMTDEVGWTKAWFDEFKSFHNSHMKTDTFNGKTIRLIDHEAMPMELKDGFLIGMNRLRGRAIQSNFIGEYSPWIEKTLGKPLTQFRRFSIVSTEKQLIHDLNGDKIQAAQTLMYSSLISLMAYSARANLKSLAQDDPDEYLDKAFTPEAMAYGVLNFMPQIAGLTMLMEGFGAVGMIPRRFQAAPGRTGIQSKYSPPVLSGVLDSVKAIQSTVNALDGEGKASDAAKNTFRLFPFQGVAGIGYITNKAKNLLE